MDYPEIELDANPPSLDRIDFSTAQIEKKKHYLRELSELQKRLSQIQVAYFHQNRKAIIVFEGWDASGKGGAIRRVTEKLDPRGFKVYPIAAPSSYEQQRHYLYRFQKRIPPKGSMAIFDRSYYGRVLVERIENFCAVEEWKRAYHEINEFERLQMDDDTRIVKIFLHITPEEQLSRFEERLNNPYKQWKLTLEDIRNREKWSAYEEAINEMFQNTSTQRAMWNLIPANHKWYARVAVLKTIIEKLSEGVDIMPPPLNMTLVNIAESQLGITHNRE